MTTGKSFPRFNGRHIRFYFFSFILDYDRLTCTSVCSINKRKPLLPYDLIKSYTTLSRSNISTQFGVELSLHKLRHRFRSNYIKNRQRSTNVKMNALTRYLFLFQFQIYLRDFNDIAFLFFNKTDEKLVEQLILQALSKNIFIIITVIKFIIIITVIIKPL